MMEIYRLHPNGSFNSNFPRSTQRLQAKASRPPHWDPQSLLKRSHNKVQPISDQCSKEKAPVFHSWIDKEVAPRLDVSHLHRLRKREVRPIGLNEKIEGANKEVVDMLFKYHLMNQTIHDKLSTQTEPYAQLHDLIIHQLFNQKSLLEFVIDQMKAKPALTNDELKETIDSLVHKKNPNGLFLLSKNSRFFIEQGIHFILPALYLKNNTFPISSTAWGHLHAGASFCLDFHLDPFKFSEEGIHLIGSSLGILAYQKNNTNIFPHFEVPATLYDFRHNLHPEKDRSLAKIYANYFTNLMEMCVIEERIFNQTNAMLNRKYQTRQEIVKDILIAGEIEPNESNVDQYIYASNHHIFAPVKDFIITNTFFKNEKDIRGKIYELAQSRDAIDVVYKKHNAEIVDIYIALNKEKLHLFFNSIYPEEKGFISSAKISFLYPIFTHTHPFRKMGRPTGLVPPPSFNDIQLGISLDLRIFSAERHRETRFYVLQFHHSFNYSLFRVGRHRTFYEPFLPKEQKRYPYFYFGTGKNPHIKNPNDPIDLFFDRIVERNKVEYQQSLFDRGYNETIGEAVTHFIKGLIPFHDFTVALIEENYDKATIKLIIDLIGLVPIIKTYIQISYLNAKVIKQAVLRGLATQTKRTAFLKTMTKEIAIDLNTLPVKSLSQKIIKNIGLALDPGLHAIYHLSQLSLKGTDSVLKQLFLFREKGKEVDISEAEEIINAIAQIQLNPMHRTDFSNIQKMSVKGEREASVVELKNFDNTIDYIRIDPISHVLFGNKYNLEKDHQLVEKKPIEMFYPSEQFVSTDKVTQLVETINQEIDAGCIARIYYGQEKRYQSDCQMTLPPKDKQLCIKQALEKERERASIQAESSEKTFYQLAQNLSTLSQKSPNYQTIERAYFNERGNYLFVKRRAQTYPMLIETLNHLLSDATQSTQAGPCPTYENTEKQIKKINREIDAGCSVPIDSHQSKTYESKCQIEAINTEETLYTINALNIDWSYLSNQLEYLEKNLTFSIQKLSELDPKSIAYQTAEESYFFEKMDYMHLKRRNQTYPMVIKKLIQSEPYQMRFIENIFLNYDSSPKVLCDPQLNKKRIFLMKDRHGNGILHYLCKTIQPQIVTFFFQCFGKENLGLKEAITHPNEAGETPLLLLIQNLSLEKFTMGYQGMFGQPSGFFEEKLEDTIHNTLFDQILTFFEYNLDTSQMQFEQVYDIFNEVAQFSNIDTHVKHWKKMERWVRKHFFDHINIINPLTGGSLFQEAMRKNNLNLMKYLTSYTHLNLQTINRESLYDFFEFICRLEEHEILIKKWLIDHLLHAINKADRSNGATCLHQAAKAREIHLVTCLIDLGANPNIQDDDQKLPSDYLNTSDLDELYEIFYRASITLTSSLKKWVSSHFSNKINTIDPEHGSTLLHKAVKNKERLLIKFLINLGANTEIQNNRGQTAASQLLLESGEDNTLFYQMFDYAAQHQGSKFEQWIKKELVTGIHLRNPKSGDTLFHWAAKEKKFSLIVYLIDLGAQGEIENFNNKTPLFYISTYFDLLYDMFHRASQMPLSKFADWMKKNLFYQINASTGPFNMTLLHYACTSKDLDFIIYLINLGADSEIETPEKKTALSYIKEKFDLLYDLFDRASRTEGSLFEEWVRAHLFDTIYSSIPPLNHNIIQGALNCKNDHLFAYIEKHRTRPTPANEKDNSTPIEGITQSPIHIPHSKLTIKPYHQSCHINQRHSIKKRALKKDLASDNRPIFFQNQSIPPTIFSPLDPISTKKRVSTISDKEEGSLLMDAQSLPPIYQTGLLFRTLFSKRQTKRKETSSYGEIQIKTLLHEQKLHTLDKHITRLIDSNKKETDGPLQLRKDCDRLKRNFAILLKKSPISIQDLRRFEADLNALKWRLKITENFQHVIEKI